MMRDKIQALIDAATALGARVSIVIYDQPELVPAFVELGAIPPPGTIHSREGERPVVIESTQLYRGDVYLSNHVERPATADEIEATKDKMRAIPSVPTSAGTLPVRAA